MIKKILCIMFCATSFIIQSMEEQSLALVDSAIDKYFSVKPSENHDKHELFRRFVGDFHNLSVEHQEINNDDIKKHIITKITDRIYYRDNRNHAYVTTSLLEHDSSYQVILDNIKEAFDPNGSIQDSWYANVTQFCDPLYTNSKTHGYNGGSIPPLSLAIKQADHNWCGRLIAEGADVNKRYQSLYGITSALSEVIFVKNRLKSNREEYPQQYKKQKKSWYIILGLLLKNKADVTLGCTEWCNHVTPYCYAIGLRDIKIVLKLFEYGATVPENSSLTAADSAWLAMVTQKMFDF